MAEKYRIEFKSQQGEDCLVIFDFADFTGTSTTLIGADNPFILREYNTDENIFKPVRPQQAEINIMSNASGVTMDDFLADSDDQITVYFSFGSYTNYWKGWVSQDDFQETWIDTYHVITIKATDGLGKLNLIELADNAEAELIGRYTPLQFLSYALYNTPNGGDAHDYYIINNLFHETMSVGLTAFDTIGGSPLDQCYLDAKTFQQQVNKYDDSLTVIKKINGSFNQTLFFYNGNWYFVRIEDLYIPFTEDITGYKWGTGSMYLHKQIFSRRFDIEVGINSEVKPISSDMMRYIVRRTKKDTVQFNYEPFDEVVCNESFVRGNLVSQTPTSKTYELSEWTRWNGLFTSPSSPTVGTFGRYETFDGVGQLNDNYIFTDYSTGATTYSYLESCDINVLKNEKFSISFQHKFKTGFSGTASQFVAYILLTGDSGAYTDYWTLDDDGKWYQSNGAWSVNLKVLQESYSGYADCQTWKITSLNDTIIPSSGKIKILFLLPQSLISVGDQKQIKDFKVTIVNSFNGIDNRGITGIQSITKKDANIINDFSDDIFLDDAFSKNYKGTIYENDAYTLTDKNWFRARYDIERHGFRKQNDIAHWEHNKFNRNKIDANFYGLTWDSTSYGILPIGLINTIKFVDDDPNKVYGILNLKEINFSKSTWSATLIELFDDDKDNSSYVSKVLNAPLTGGSHSTITHLPFSPVTLADFTINSTNDKLTFEGGAALTAAITCTVVGIITGYSSTPVNIYLMKNGLILTSVSITPTSTSYNFSINLSTTSTSILYLDYFEIDISPNLTSLVIISGGINISYLTPPITDTDTYSDKFIYQ